MKPTPIATPVKAFEAIAPATNLKPITNSIAEASFRITCL